MSRYVFVSPTGQDGEWDGRNMAHELCHSFGLQHFMDVVVDVSDPWDEKYNLMIEAGNDNDALASHLHYWQWRDLVNYFRNR